MATQNRLGVVTSPEPGHEAFRGRLAIPYIDMVGVYAIKFRCLADHDCKEEKCTKYLNLPGQDASLYGVVDTDSTCDTIHVTEGELDRLVVKQVFADQPAVGVPGVNHWKPHHPFHFGGFERVLLWMDGDQAGKQLGDRIRGSVRAAEVVSLPDGYDVSSWFVEVGGDVLRAMVGMDEEE